MKKTYYEQVQVESVKKMMEKSINPVEQTLASGNGLAEAGGWRELAMRVQQETDSNKVLDLVEQLIARFDEERATPGQRVKKAKSPSFD